MKIRPVILCGGEGTRLWPKSKNNQAKQFINFGGWNLFEKTLDRIKGKTYHPSLDHYYHYWTAPAGHSAPFNYVVSTHS